MKKVPGTHPIGLASGVLSLAGLCLGIVSLGKKAEARTGSKAVPPVQPQSEPSPRPEMRPAEASIVDPIVNSTRQVEPAVIESRASEDCEHPLRLSEDSEVEDFARKVLTSSDLISDLAREGRSPIEIAQVLGISVGEVQLTLKLQERSAAAGRRV
jgi:hypothetical protein